MFTLLSNQFDLKILEKLPRPFIGVDEVGRGCLAGPVCAGVVILNEDQPHDHFQDSKTLKEDKRNKLAEEIRARHTFALGWASVEEIEQINIRQATFLAMTRALQSLSITTGTILIDGRDLIPGINHLQQWAIIKGDQHMRCISAASIVAKVARDELMMTLAKDYPAYGFEKHKGYATEIHRTAIAMHKPTPLHRKTFAGVKEYLAT